MAGRLAGAEDPDDIHNPSPELWRKRPVLWTFPALLWTNLWDQKFVEILLPKRLRGTVRRP
jgi:uncharacterized membrane protein YcfT